MKRLRVLLLTTSMLLPASRLRGQVLASGQDGGVYNTPVVCNDGTIAFSVARAFRDLNTYRSSQWVIQGWYSVGPGQCNEIGPEEHYTSGGWFGEDSVILLAFAFRDSTGVWGATKVRDTTDGLFKPSNQQLCVQDGAFRYGRATSQGDPAKECDRGLPGYYRIPVSLEFKGDAYGGFYGGYLVTHGGRDRLHVRLGPNDRAIPSGPQSSSHTSSNVGPKPAADDGNSFGAQVLKALANSVLEAGNKPSPKPAATSEAEGRAAFLYWVREDVTAYIAASATRFEAYKTGEVILQSGYHMWNSKVVPLKAKGCWVVDGPVTSTFSCLLSAAPDLNAIRSYYTELTEDVAVSLPGDWKPEAAPPFGGDLPSKGFRSIGGAHGEIWIDRAASGGEYQLQYQLVSAPAAR